PCVPRVAAGAPGGGGGARLVLTVHVVHHAPRAALLSLGTDESEALEVAAMRPHALADQLDEAEVLTGGDAEPAVVLSAREPNGDEDASTIALLHATRLFPRHPLLTLTTCSCAMATTS